MDFTKKWVFLLNFFKELFKTPKHLEIRPPQCESKLKIQQK